MLVIFSLGDLKNVVDSKICYFLLLQSNGHISLGGGDHYQERLSRIESDKESLVLQVLNKQCLDNITRSTETEMLC